MERTIIIVTAGCMKATSRCAQSLLGVPAADDYRCAVFWHNSRYGASPTHEPSSGHDDPDFHERDYATAQVLYEENSVSFESMGYP